LKRKHQFISLYLEQSEVKMPPKKCGRCDKTVYPTEELKCLDKVCGMHAMRLEFKI